MLTFAFTRSEARMMASHVSWSVLTFHVPTQNGFLVVNRVAWGLKGFRWMTTESALPRALPDAKFALSD